MMRMVSDVSGDVTVGTTAGVGVRGQMTNLMRIYQAASQPVRWQFWCTVGLFIANIYQRITAAGLEQADGSTLARELVTRDNFMLGVATVFAAGILYTQFKDIAMRLKAQEEATKHLREEHLPQTYVRRDVLEAQLERLTDMIAKGNRLS